MEKEKLDIVQIDEFTVNRSAYTAMDWEKEEFLASAIKANQVIASVS